jgi:Cu-Zn family superoxide dismutase
MYSRTTKAVAVIHPTQGNAASGTVTFEHQPQGMLVTAKIHGLTPGEHGFHIHEYGNCSCADALCAGDHFNPTHKNHGGPHNPERHVGDLGNITADARGNVQYEYVDTFLTLNGPHSIIGRSVIVHEQRDDLVSQPVGNAGARVGCGVIGIAPVK